ncbi:hypothetical protein PR001_g25737 [Phytophthora rubi]|uniref:Uncharacterized protein n=1 Tax=Phytophthora rubi TaxID=129364 RepID=A0A6A3I553_9STRA|nr:hypothetical protein PR001_g25737 [Phytophthora rubi]
MHSVLLVSFSSLVQVSYASLTRLVQFVAQLVRRLRVCRESSGLMPVAKPLERTP